MRADRIHGTAFWILAAAVVVTHLLGAGSLAGTLWGADAFAYLPPGALVGACLVLAALLLAALLAPRGVDRALLALPRLAGSSPSSRRLRALAGAGVFLVSCWLFREGHTLLGDGRALTLSLPQGQTLHPLEPLGYLLQHGLFQLVSRLYPASGRSPTELARDSVALGSALAGALFVPVAWGLAREIARRGAAEPGEASERDREALVPLVFVLLLAQGYVQLFFGYVEDYTFYTLALGAYLLAALRCLGGRAPLALPLGALVLATSLHLSALALAPSFAVLAVAALLDPKTRLAGLRDLVLGALVVALAGLGLMRLLPGYDPVGALSGLGRTLIADLVSPPTGYPLASWRHALDFVNEQLLIGPAALAVLIGGAVGWVAQRDRGDGAAWFGGVAGLGYLAACGIAGDSNLGYARNWDLLAPAGLAFLAAGLVLAMRGAWQAAKLRRWLLLLVALSLFHTLPWLAVNASFDRSFARLKALPLGLGRTEVVVGTWYLEHRDTTQAVAWFERSLEAYPGNGTAAFSLGWIEANRGRYRQAAGAFWTALQSRPDKQEFRFSLVNAIVRGGGPPLLAKAHLDTLLAREPRDPTYWAAYGVVCLGAGRRDLAVAAFARARELAPADTLIAALPRRLAQPDGYERAVREDWPAIVGP